MSIVPGLVEHTVHVWWASPAAAAPWLHELLDDVERQRRERLRREPDRQRFVVGCALLKLAVAAQTGQDPATVRLTRTCPDCQQPHGKPHLPASGIELSLSHSGDRVVAAMARHTPVGIDVEQEAPRLDPEQLAGSVLTEAEAAAFTELPATARQTGFLTYWTRKEAVLKATGVGLRTPLRAVEVIGSPVKLPDCPDEIHWHDLDAGTGHVAALAIVGGPPSRELRHFDAGLLFRP